MLTFCWPYPLYHQSERWYEFQAKRGCGNQQTNGGWTIRDGIERREVGLNHRVFRDLDVWNYCIPTNLISIHIEGLLFVGQRGNVSDSPRIKMVSYTSSYRGIFSGLSPEVCPEATKTLKRPTVCLVSCMQMLTECSLWLFHASWVWGYDSCQVVSNSQNTDCVWLWVWQTSSKHIDDIASTECTEGSGKQPLIEYHRSLKGIPTPTASYGHQFSVSWGHHFVEWSPRFFFSVVSRASTARCWGNWKSITLKNRIPCQSTCCIWAANGFFESKGCPKGCQKKGGSPVVGFFNATRKGCLRTYHTSYHF